ncbi:MAG: MBL fold metallo-hydrolase [Acidimicrobiia bacterium]|nr:MBL fold metallo-hydrolase [Acidimicrobiia bacterium]
MLSATFYGVRGSTPCSCDSTREFGGNTACVLVEVPDEPPIICDLGTGLRYLGRDLDDRGQSNGFAATALISHLHWDHIQGTPFFRPLLGEGATLEIVGPRQNGSTLETEFTRFVRPPVFPVAIDQLPGDVTFRDATDEVIQVGSATVQCFDVPHIGPTNGYRIDVGSGSLAYISDHQQPMDGSLDVADSLVEACRDVDILVHDAQFDHEEFQQRSDWGHCTPEYALELARRSGARRLVLFHHDPGHDDAWVRATVKRIQGAAGTDVTIIGAAEGLRLESGN